MGAFYAETQITSEKQTDVAGSFISNIIDMGQEVPKIFQIPTLNDYLPPGMPGDDIWVIRTIVWQEL